VTNDVGITQAGADKAWSTAARALTDKAGFSLSTAGIKAIWDQLTSALSTVGSIGKLLVDNINATISSRAPEAGGNVAAIKAKTDNLPADPADDSDIDAQLATIAGYLDTEIAAILAAVDTEVAAILADTGTDGVVISTATAQAIADEILKRSMSNVEATAGDHTLAALVLAVLESVLSGTTWTIKKTDGSTTFLTKTVTTNAAALPVVEVK